LKKILGIVDLLKRTIQASSRDRTPLLAAAIAFYTVLSLAPSLLVVVAVAGTWFGREMARAEVIAAIEGAMGPAGAQMISDVLQRVEERSSMATVAGVVSMFFGATVMFAALQDSLNSIWKVPPRQGGFVRDFLAKRLVSFAVVLLLGLLLFASLMTGAVIAAAARMAPASLPASSLLLQLANLVLSVLLMTVMFGVIYKILPDAHIHWSDVWVGAAFTSVLFTLGKTLIGLYLGYSSLGSAYGAAGSLVVFLIWVYYSAQIFLVGGEFTHVYAETHGKSITPKTAPLPEPEAPVSNQRVD
jgi:membrane protein